MSQMFNKQNRENFNDFHFIILYKLITIYDLYLFLVHQRDKIHFGSERGFSMLGSMISFLIIKIKITNEEIEAAEQSLIILAFQRHLRV